MADAAYHIRDGPSWPVGGQGPARGQRLDVVALTAIPCAAFIPTFVAGQKAIRHGAVAVAGLLIGIFAVTAVMTGIIAGGIGLRLVHTGSKHKNATDAMIAEWPAAKDSLRNGEPYGRACRGRTQSLWLIPVRSARSSDVRGRTADDKRGRACLTCMIIVPVAGDGGRLGLWSRPAGACRGILYALPASSPPCAVCSRGELEPVPCGAAPCKLGIRTIHAF